MKNKNHGNKRSFSPKKRIKKLTPKPDTIKKDDAIRLNKYIANSGICSRREADEYIQNGLVTVNGKVVKELGVKVKPDDEVRFAGELIKNEKPVYILLNKPKNVVTTVKDPQRRITVMDIIKGACKERVYPVGRLDKDTTGLLLLTNDGDLTMKLTHPRHGVKKIYHVVTNKKVKKEDLIKMLQGVETEVGIIKADKAEYVEGKDNQKEIGIELHSGKNRAVRRMFEALGYKVVKLDRVYFAGLTKKKLPRGKWRFLTREEINMLKMLG
ncbi:MAG: rRNA pseudouridine synthase [Bacteroidetes bacterium]|nr:MAG: rRNA pseudouridine synthase [Bacteroidota bacterium]